MEQSRDEYIGSVYGAAALGYIAIMHAAEALDMLQERLPAGYKEARRYASRITGTKASIGEARRLELAIGDQLAHAADRAWMADFGNAAYGRVLPQVTALQTAIANALGRHPSLPDRNTCAAVVVAQSLAHEAAEYVRRRAAKFTGFTITTHDGQRMSVSRSLASMAAHDIEARAEDTDMRRPSCEVRVKAVNTAALRLTYSTASLAKLCATTTAAHVLRSGSVG